MRNLLIDLISIGGLGLFSYGLYLGHGLATSLTVSGAVLMVVGVISQLGGRR